MEAAELINSFIKIIKDSGDPDNKIGHIDTYDILREVRDIEPMFSERHIEDWIEYCKMRKPGYIIEDLIIIFSLGKVGVFGQFTAYDSETLKDWLFQYGIKHQSKEDPTSKRNYYLGEAVKMIERRIRENKVESISLAELKNKEGVKYMKENFPFLIGLLKKNYTIGENIEDIPITNKKYNR